MSAAQVEELYERLGRMLDRIGVETQPKVASRVLELSQDPESSARDFHDVIKADVALTGRVLKLANSAFFAQRQPVTRLDRAIVVLGTERAKAITLGFYISRAAMGGGKSDGPAAEHARKFGRVVWGASLYRACLASGLSKLLCPHLSSEAFIVGLMLDGGQPLMAKLLGEQYVELAQHHLNPTEMFAAETRELEYTHVDVIVSLTRRWKLPTVLAKPIAWHHMQPSALGGESETGAGEKGKSFAQQDAAHQLHRIAYYAGCVQLHEETSLPVQKLPDEVVVRQTLEVAPGELERVIVQSGREYQAIISLFSDMCDELSNVNQLLDRVQVQLAEAMDAEIARGLANERKPKPEKMTVAGLAVEVEPGRQGEVVAFLNGSDGKRLFSCTVNPNKETPDSIGKMLGLEEANAGELQQLVRVMNQIAA